MNTGLYFMATKAGIKNDLQTLALPILDMVVRPRTDVPDKRCFGASPRNDARCFALSKRDISANSDSTVVMVTSPIPGILSRVIHP